MLNKKRNAMRAIEELEAAGFLRYAKPSFDRDLWLRHALKGDPFQRECGRVFDIDAEDLFERGPADFLEEMADFLNQAGSPINGYSVIRIPHQETRLCLNGRTFVMASVEDLRTDAAWTPSFLRFVGALDWIVQRGGSGERCYYAAAGNDGMICFLTIPMVQALKNLSHIVPLSYDLFSLEEPIR